MAITNATTLADYAAGISTQNATLKVDSGNKRVGIGTTNPKQTLQVGTAVSVYGNSGIVSATSFYGDGANLTSISASGLTGTPDITVRNITGVAATFTGVLTYEDVTNVDSVGIVTARGGLEVGAAGVGGTVSALGHVEFVGVTTIGLGLTLTDNIQARFGDAGDLKIYHNGSHSYVDNATGSLFVKTDNQIYFQDTGGNRYADFVDGGAVKLYYSNAAENKKFETTETGTITTGISTADGFSVGDNEYITVGVGSDLVAYHDGTHTYITNTTGDLRITDTGGGGLIIGSNSLNLRNSARDENYFVGNNGGSAEIYFNNSKKIETHNTGIRVTGIATVTSTIYVNTNGSSIAENNLNFVSSGKAYIDHGTTGQDIDFRLSHGSAKDRTAITIGSAGITTFYGTPHDDLGNLRDIPLRSVTGSAATLVVGDAGKVVSTNTTGWTVPASTFSEGDTVTLLNNSAGGLVITCSAVTTYLTSDGTTVTSSTLGARGMATLYFVSSSVAYLQGTALS